MAEGKDAPEDYDSFLKEEFAHVEELLISSREECIDISSKYEGLNKQVQDLIQFQKDNESDESITSEQSETHKEFRYSVEEQFTKYENQIATYQHTQARQAEIVGDLQTRVEEYRMRCAKLEAALAEQKIQEAAIEETDFQTQNVFSMDLETALIRLEQEKNRSQGLTEINKLLREQLETATEVNQTLTSDVHRLTKEWQQARSELLAKESEWKDEEQTISMYITKESNILLSFWKQILDFKHDFANLKSATEKDLSSFKICICQNLENIKNIQNLHHSFQETDSSINSSDSLKFDRKIKVEDFFKEREKLQERINDLIDRNEKIQWLLDEKEKVNTTLYNTIEQINTSMKSTVNKTVTETKEIHVEKVCKEYINVVKSFTEILLDDPKSEISSNIALSFFDTLSLESKSETFTDENISQFQSIFSAVKNTFQKFSKQLDDATLNLSSVKEQNSMQQRTIEFLEDEREKMQELNTKLSSQFESLHQKYEEFLKDKETSGNFSEDDHSSYVDVIVKSLNDKIESLNSENARLLEVQQELQAKLNSLSEEKRNLLTSEQTLQLDVNKNLKKISVLEKNMDSLRKDYLQTQEVLQQTTLEKELLQEEKQKFSTLLSNFEQQCFELKNCLQQLKDEESVVQESLVTVQTLNESLALEKNDLTQFLNETTSEIERLKEEQSQKKIEFEKEKNELKSRLDELKEKCIELEHENEKLHKDLKETESLKSNIEEEKSEMNLQNTDLTNQVTKYSTQKKNVETELEKVREELKQLLEQSEKVNLENNMLLRSKSELSVKLEALENDVKEMNDTITLLREEKANLEKALFDAQKLKTTIQEEKADLQRELDHQKSSIVNLEAQVKELQELHKKYVDETVVEKRSLIMKMQEIEQGFQVSLKKEQDQHNVDIDILTQEKDALREKLISSVDELIKYNDKQKEELNTAHQTEVANLKKQISLLETELEEKNITVQSQKIKVDSDHKLKISELENTIENLKQQLSENDTTSFTLEDKILQFEAEKESLIQNHKEVEQKLNAEISNLNLKLSNCKEELENAIKELNNKEYKLEETAEEKITILEIQIKELKADKDRLSKELQDTNLYLKNEKISKSQLEDKIALLQNQLSDEKNLCDVLNKSLDDCKQRLKVTQAENVELKAQVEEANHKLDVLEDLDNKKSSKNIELKSTLQDMEKTRQELKREVSNLKSKLNVVESSLKVKEQEITELIVFRNKGEEKEEELKKEILSLKQKLLESSASSEALTKEMMSLKQKLSNMEHKLKMQQEQHHSALHESLTNEQSLSEYRLNLERSMADTTKEIQRLRSSLNYEEGKVLALESRVVKLDGAKREIENKLFSLCCFLRSALCLVPDSGFLSISANMISPIQKSQKSADGSRFSDRDSPHRRSSPHAQLYTTDNDIELLKSSFMEMIEKYSSIEKERDDLKDSISRLQKQEQELRNEHSKCLAKIYQLKKELDDKRNIENDLATKISSVHHYEENIRTLEREKRRLIEKAGNLEFNLTAVTREKESLIEKIDEMKKVIIKHEQELKTVVSAKEVAETKASKYFQSYQHFEVDVSNLKEIIAIKEKEIRSLEHSLQTTNKKLLSSENRNKSLQETIEKLNSAIARHIDNEQLLQQKVNSLSSKLSRRYESNQNVHQELEKILKENKKFQKEISYLQESLEKARESADEYQSKNKMLLAEIEDLKNNINLSQQNENDKVRNLQNLLNKTKELEKESAQEINQLQIQKSSLERKITEMNVTLREYKSNLREKEETCLVLEREKKSLQKTLEKIERENHKTSEATAKSLIEKSSLGRTLTKLEIENATLQEKVQNLQAQLAELEERHTQRIKDFIKSQSIESKFEEERLRTTLKQTEQLLEAREKTHRQRVLGLEEQISVLKNHLEREKQRWQLFHQRSAAANANINYLHTVISKSLQNVSEDPQKLLPEAERLDLTTEIELTSSPGISVSTPSKLSQSSSYTQRTSTPKSKRCLDLSPKKS